MKVKLQIISTTLFYSGLFFVANYFDGSSNYLDLFLFSIGVLLGLFLMYFDEEFLYQYYLEPRATKINLITRSLLFIFSLFPLGVFIITSTGSELGVGLFLGIITTLLFELIRYRSSVGNFHTRFLFQLKRKLSIQEINFFVTSFGILTLIFVLLTFFLGR